jgi:hypothetical protein
VTAIGEGPSDETAVTLITALPPAERRALAALAVVGRASLSADELTELTEVQDIASLVADLERRGLIRRDEKQRCALGRFGEEIRKTDDALTTGENLLQYMTTLAKGGQLTPARLLDDTEAILGLTEWAAEWQRWERLLELVKTLQAGFGIESRIEQWLTLLDRGHRAARALGDRPSEVWALQQLAAASAIAGKPSVARRYRREADDLQRSQLGLSGAKGDGSGSVQTVVDSGGGRSRIALWILGLIAAAAAGGATSYAIANGNGDSGTKTVTTRVPVTATAGGQTVTTTTPVTLPTNKTVTLPPTTVTVTVTTTPISTTPSSSSSSPASP